jgi:hypothetical protein
MVKNIQLLLAETCSSRIFSTMCVVLMDNACVLLNILVYPFEMWCQVSVVSSVTGLQAGRSGV